MLLLPLAASASRVSKGTTVRVDATEFAFVLSAKTVPRGAVTFLVVNDGMRAHDFSIAGRRTALIAPGHSAKLTVAFRKARSYVYFCTVAGHAVAGMKGVLRVT